MEHDFSELDLPFKVNRMVLRWHFDGMNALLTLLNSFEYDFS